MPDTRRLDTLLWLAVLAGVGYGIHTWGGRLHYGLREDRDLVEELAVGLIAMPLYVPAFLALYLLYRGWAVGDRAIAAASAIYVLTIVTLEVAGGDPYENHELLLDGQLSLVAFALPICTTLSGVLVWRWVKGARGYGGDYGAPLEARPTGVRRLSRTEPDSAT